MHVKNLTGLGMWIPVCRSVGSDTWGSVGVMVESWEWTHCPEDSCLGLCFCRGEKKTKTREGDQEC